jgi:hypothetical protein
VGFCRCIKGPGAPRAANPMQNICTVKAQHILHQKHMHCQHVQYTDVHILVCTYIVHVSFIGELEFNIIQWCCYITVDSATNALQNHACIYRCISKQMHNKTPFSHNGFMKSLEFSENYITLFCLEKTNFLTILY